MKYVIFIALILGFFDKEYTIDDFRWKNRLVLIGGQNAGLVDKQAKTFLKFSKENQDRKLLIFQWNTKKQSFYEEKTGFVLKEKNFANEFEIRLYGLDGGVKNENETVTDPQRIYDLIDSMPMRTRELRNRRE